MKVQVVDERFGGLDYYEVATKKELKGAWLEPHGALAKPGVATKKELKGGTGRPL